MDKQVWVSSQRHKKQPIGGKTESNNNHSQADFFQTQYKTLNGYLWYCWLLKQIYSAQFNKMLTIVYPHFWIRTLERPDLMVWYDGCQPIICKMRVATKNSYCVHINVCCPWHSRCLIYESSSVDSIAVSLFGDMIGWKKKCKFAVDQSGQGGSPGNLCLLSPSLALLEMGTPSAFHSRLLQ